jgi:hypothetical protein
MERHRYIVRLSTEERVELSAIVKKGKGNAHKIRNAQILLHSDENGERLTVEAIARLLREQQRYHDARIQLKRLYPVIDD